MLASAAPAEISGRSPAYPRGLAWWAVAVTAVFQIFSMIDRMIVAVLIPEMRVDLGLNDFQISLVQGMAFALFYGVVGLFIGGLVDRYSRRWIMFGGIVLWSAAAAGTGLARNYAQLFLGRLLVGFGEGAISPSAQSLLSSIFPRERLSTAMSCFTAAGVAGISLSFLLGGFLLQQLSHSPLGGVFDGLAPWRQVLIVTGLPGVAVAFLAFTLREPQSQRSPVSRQGGWGAFFRFLRGNGRLLGGMLGGYTLSAMMTQGAMTWAPTYARVMLGLSPATVGAMMGLAVALGGIIGTIGLGLIIDSWFARGRRDAALLTFTLMALVAPPLAALAFTANSAPLMFAAIFGLLFTLGASFGPGLAAIQMVSPVAMRGRFGALAAFASNLGGAALGPMLIGAITDYVLRDQAQVGTSIAIALALLGPLAALSLWWAKPAFVARLAD
jgi:MFS family permease